MLIGILQSGHFAQREGAPLRDYSTLYAEMLAGHGFRFKTWSVVDMEFPASPEDADGWLISGSKHGVYDDLPFIAPLEEGRIVGFLKQKPALGGEMAVRLLVDYLNGESIPARFTYTPDVVTQYNVAQFK